MVRECIHRLRRAGEPITIFQTASGYVHLDDVKDPAMKASIVKAHRERTRSYMGDHAALMRRAEEVIVAVAMTEKQHRPVASLPHGDQRKVEVALLMALEPEVFMFDEPTAGMSVDEAPVILNLIRQLKADKSKTILLVEHKMDVVRELADRIIVLHNGALVADGEPAAVIASPIVQEAYLGVVPAIAMTHGVAAPQSDFAPQMGMTETP